MTTRQLKAPTLLRDRCCVAGEWIPAGSGKTVDVTTPATQTPYAALAFAELAEFGLAAYVYARDIGRIWRGGEAPFGGVRQSGPGREGSKYGLDDFLEIKHLCLGGMD